MQFCSEVNHLVYEQHTMIHRTCLRLALTLLPSPLLLLIFYSLFSSLVKIADQPLAHAAQRLPATSIAFGLNSKLKL